MTEPVKWRLTLEFANYAQAEHALTFGHSIRPERLIFDALDAHGQPLWHEEGDPWAKKPDSA